MRVLTAVLSVLVFVAGCASGPKWVALPAPAAVADAFPGFAADAGIEGFATLNCKTTPAHGFADCRIVKEAPSDLGFGDAAVSLAAGYKLAGQAGDEVEFSVNFALPPIARIAPWRGAEPTPEALALARQVTARLNLSLVDGASAIRLEGLPTERREAVRAILADIDRETRADYREAYALDLARTQQVSNLRLLTVGQRRATPPAWPEAELERARDQLTRVSDRQNALIRVRYCARYDCDRRH